MRAGFASGDSQKMLAFLKTTTAYPWGDLNDKVALRRLYVLKARIIKVVVCSEKTRRGKRKYANGAENSATGARRKKFNSIWNPINNPIYSPIWNPIKNPIWNPIWNPINNPIWNPIYSARNQEATRLNAEQRIRTMCPDEFQITPEFADLVATWIAEEPMESLNGLNLNQLVTSHSVYIGYTKRLIHMEALRWLTQRGAARRKKDKSYKVYDGSRNRPVLLWSNRKNITKKEAQDQFDFQFIELASFTLMMNARRVEDALQKKFDHLPLGHKLWRKVDRGGKYDKKVDGALHKVFLTFSAKAMGAAQDGTIIVNH